MTGNNIMQKTTDRQARKYTITLNNPLDMNPPMTHEQIKKSIGELCSVTYWCMADEVGVKEQTPHTHIYLYSVSPIRFQRLNVGLIKGISNLHMALQQKTGIIFLKPGNGKILQKQKPLSPARLKNLVLCRQRKP